MAYGNTGSKFGNNNVRPAAGRPVANASTGTGTKREYILSTGLFRPTKEGVKALASVQLKEDVVIPAGSFISIYENDRKTKDSQPDFRMTVAAGNLKK